MFEWIDNAADIIDSIGTPRFPDALAAGLRAIAPFEYSVVFGYVGDARPIDLHDDFPKTKRKVFVEDYQEGPYLLDPFFIAASQPVAPKLYRLRELAPDRFYQGEYFRNYYEQTGLAEEIGYFVDVPGNGLVVVSLMRAQKAFSAREIRHLRAVWPIVRSTGQRHWRDFPSQVDAHPESSRISARSGRVNQAFQTFGEGILTPREREVVEHTLKGHSADAVGTILGISSGTVRIHRRNIYAKMRINSQGELFSKFIETVL